MKTGTSRIIQRANSGGVRLTGLCILLSLVTSLAACIDRSPLETVSPFTSPESAPAEPGPPVLLEGGTIVDTRNGNLVQGMDVLLQNGKIAAIGSRGSLSPPADSARLNINGKYLVPGYLDMHAHTLQWPNPAPDLGLMLANGITGFRAMAGSPEWLAERKNGAVLSLAEAPELLIMPGSVLVRQNTSTPERARAEVRSQHAMGADFIKVVDTTPAEYLAALDESTRLGLPFVGHLPASLSVAEAAANGMRAIEHLGPNDSIVLSCSSDEAALRKAIAEAGYQGPPVLPDFVFNLIKPILDRYLEKVIANPILMVTSDDDFALMQKIVDSYDADRCAQVAQELAKSGMWQVPTLIRINTMEFGDDPLYSLDPNLAYVTSKRLAFWRSIAADFSTDVPAGHREILKRFNALQMMLFNAFNTAGVKMLAGSDVGGQWLVPGFSLHQEFDLLAAAGATPLQVLQMTTLNGAEFLGREATMGTVEAGKDANLVVLDANPVASVANLHSIHAVVRNGRVLTRPELDAMIEGARNR